MTITLSTTNLEVIPELNAVNLTITPTFTSGGGGGIPEAPIDGKQYARKDADWAEVAASGGTVESVTSTDNHIVVDNTDPANPVLSFQTVANTDWF